MTNQITRLNDNHNIIQISQVLTSTKIVIYEKKKLAQNILKVNDTIPLSICRQSNK